MARHRSPRAHRFVALRRGGAAVAVAGGALTVMGSAAPVTAAPEVILTPSVVPVVPEPAVLDASRLVAAVQLAERQVVAAKAASEKAAAEKAAAEKAAAGCGIDTSDLGAVTKTARAAAEFLGCRFGEPTMYGVAGRGGASDHPSGRAVDFMVGRATGDALAACALVNKDALGITYVIWRQRINYGGGWRAMEDRGGVTANHFDHVHVSFGSGSGDGPPTAC